MFFGYYFSPPTLFSWQKNSLSGKTWKSFAFLNIGIMEINAHIYVLLSFKSNFLLLFTNHYHHNHYYFSHYHYLYAYCCHKIHHYYDMVFIILIFINSIPVPKSIVVAIKISDASCCFKLQRNVYKIYSVGKTFEWSSISSYIHYMNGHVHVYLQ